MDRLFGPSGSGKTSALRTIAGFERPDSGRITYREQTLVDIGAGVFVPPHIRLVRTATQSARLFPHMTVAENIGYGVSLRSKPHDRRDLDIDINDRRDFIAEVLKLFRVAALAQRLPRELSGGEAQRVSLARAAASAVASAPDRALLLLDEPFGGMDVALRDEILLELKVWLSKWNTPVLSVTHDLGEAFLLDAEVIKIADGRGSRTRAGG